MYCSSKHAKKFLKIERSNKNVNFQKENDEINLNGISSISPSSINDSTNQLSQALDLFTMCLPKEVNNGSYSRRPTALELALLPEIMHDLQLPVSQKVKSEAAQLTIFYAGTINVYDNVCVDKAQSILNLARESSLLSGSTSAKSLPKEAKPTQKSQVPCPSKFQADLPIARRKSLKRFFEKRHNRFISKRPYASPVITQRDNECDDGGDDQSGNDSLKAKRS